MARYLPPDWPESVQPPGSDGWEATAVSWLLGLVPEYRQYPVVCSHPLALAYIARHLVHGSVEGARQAHRTVRSELAEHAPPHAADAALDAYRVQDRRLAATERAVELVERALRGERILSGPRSAAPSASLGLNLRRRAGQVPAPGIGTGRVHESLPGFNDRTDYIC